MEELEERLAKLEQQAKQAECDIRYLKDTTRQVANRNKSLLAEVKKVEREREEGKAISYQNARAKEYVQTLKKAARVEAEVANEVSS